MKNDIRVIVALNTHPCNFRLAIFADFSVHIFCYFEKLWGTALSPRAYDTERKQKHALEYHLGHWYRIPVVPVFCLRALLVL